MKNLVLLMILLASTANADAIHCLSEGNKSYGTGVTDKITAKCISFPDWKAGDWSNSVETIIVGKGISLYFTGIDAFNLHCPSKSLKQLRGQTLYGAKASVTLPWGFAAGIFSNTQTTCFLDGGQTGLGGSLVGAQLTLN